MKVITLIGLGFCALLLFSICSVSAGEINNPPDAANHNAVTGVTQIIAKRKTPVVTWSSPLPISVGVALGPDQLNAKANVPGTFVYSPPSGTILNVGPDQTLSVRFTPKDQDHYRSVDTQVKITVNPKADPVITWANPADITYGVALGSEQLNATADVPGTFNYTPPSGTVLIAGLNRALTAAFTPTDDVNYNPLSKTVYINVNEESPVSFNHPPVLTNIETDSILYELGDKAIPISKEVIISDMDDSFMCSARVALTENYKKGDLLTLDGAANLKIKTTYNALTGELVLSGKDSKSNYETALHNVLFSSPVSGDTSVSVRQVSIVVKDSTTESNLASRTIQIANEFPALSIVNAFTPNSDRVNDYWDFGNLQFYKEIKVAVFDQNGMRVYNCAEKDCKWDGKNKGKDLPAGPYYYSINLDKGKRTYRGTVTILK